MGRDRAEVGPWPIQGALEQRRGRSFSLEAANLPMVYACALVVWLLSRVLVLAHQGAWLWINTRIYGHAHEIAQGDWGRAVEVPILPSLVALPFVQLTIPQQPAIWMLYVVASLVQFGAFVLVVRQLFPDSARAQVLALGLFLVVPINHSIHHYRNIATIFASAAMFLLAAHWLRQTVAHRPPLRLAASATWVIGAILLGAGSRLESVAFAAYLVGLGLFIPRARAVRLPLLYGVCLVGVVGAQASLSALASQTPIADRVVPTSDAAVEYAYEGRTYLVHAFLDSTPYSWLSPECRAALTEVCRVQEGERLFGPEDQAGGLVGLILARPGLVVLKTAQSAWDNLWTLFGVNLSTYPGMLWAVLAALALFAPVRAALGTWSPAVLCVVAAALGVSVWPLSWGPPQPQFHLHTVLVVTILVVPTLAALARLPRAAWVVAAFWAGTAALSAFRYTRYTGY